MTESQTEGLLREDAPQPLISRPLDVLRVSADPLAAADTLISRIDIREFTFGVKNTDVAGNSNDGRRGGGGTPGGATGHAPGQTAKMTRCAVIIETSDGSRGEYVTRHVGTKSAHAQSLMPAPMRRVATPKRGKVPTAP